MRAPVKVPPGYPGFPNRDAPSSAPPPGLAPAEHSEDQRARVEGPSEGRVPWHMQRSLVPASGACALCAHADGVPLLGVLRTSAVIGARSALGGNPRQSADRPRPSFRQLPAKGTAFQKTRMPFTVTPREGLIGARRDCSLRPSRRLSRSRRPHFLPMTGRVLLMGIARSRRGHPHSVTGSRVQTPLLPAGTSAPGTDDPSTPTSSTDPAVDEDRLPRSHRCRSQRLDGFYDRVDLGSFVSRLANVFIY
jgi:hypothetical protein